MRKGTREVEEGQYISTNKTFAHAQQTRTILGTEANFGKEEDKDAKRSKTIKKKDKGN